MRPGGSWAHCSRAELKNWRGGGGGWGSRQPKGILGWLGRGGDTSSKTRWTQADNQSHEEINERIIDSIQRSVIMFSEGADEVGRGEWGRQPKGDFGWLESVGDMTSKSGWIEAGSCKSCEEIDVRNN